MSDLDDVFFAVDVRVEDHQGREQSREPCALHGQLVRPRTANLFVRRVQSLDNKDLPFCRAVIRISVTNTNTHHQHSTNTSVTGRRGDHRDRGAKVKGRGGGCGGYGGIVSSDPYMMYTLYNPMASLMGAVSVAKLRLP